jgi:hypothetical protein
MKDLKQKLPALVLSAVLLASFSPAWPGGRDVPDRMGEDSSASEEYVLPGGGEAWCPEIQVATTFSLGSISLDIVRMPEGSLRLQPSLLTDATQILRRTFGSGTGGSSCPTR